MLAFGRLALDGHCMRRRNFIALLSGPAAWPLAARAQQDERVRRIGVLMGTAERDPEHPSRIAAFEQGLGKLGWRNGGNIRIEYRYGDGDVERMRKFAAELVALAPDVVLATNTPTLVALRQQTQTIPTVFVSVSDPIGSGFVASLVNPGGNVTGFITVEPSLGAKWLQLLKEIAPSVKRVAVVFRPETAPHAGLFMRAAEAAASTLGVEVIAAEARDDAQIEAAFAKVGREAGGGVIGMADNLIVVRREQIVALAAKYRLPAIYPYRFFVTGGGLISYGVDLLDLYRPAAIYIDRILRGAKPADLPVQAASKFELVINLTTAKALGLDVPLSLMIRADEMIE
jgi:putative tryptophan/tyrosine transport system substrate-binding protein